MTPAKPDEPAPKGTPTPGHRTPQGRPEEAPAVTARTLDGTTPKPTNARPSAPQGSGSAPTAPRPVEQGRPSQVPASPPPGRPDMAPPGERSDEPVAEGERPANPFEPKPKPARTSRLPLLRGRPDPETPSGKRVAEAPKKRFGRSKTADKAPLGGRNVAALTIAGIAAVAVIALIVSTGLWWFNRDTQAASAPGTQMSATPGPVLGAGQMLTEPMAKSIDPGRIWHQTVDQAGVNDASPQIACIGPQAADQPMPEITQLRGVSASGDDRTAALHRADAYATAEDAKKVFEFRSAELGSCTDTPIYVEKGLDVTGIGDQALGVRLVLHDLKNEYHSVLLVRTGRVVNLLDVARVGGSVDMTAQVKALGQSINRQCGPAVGLCTAPTTNVTVGVPPAGGAQRGFLTSGDIPRVTAGSGIWRGNPPGTKVDIQDGSSCEAVDFNTIGGTGVNRQSRTYMLRNDAAAPPQFGIDQVVLTMGTPEEATQLVDRVSQNISTCGTRTLTSQMAKQAALLTPGQEGVEVKGNWFIVNSKIDQAQSQKYRVGIFAAGNKVVYLRANPTETFDFSDDSWIGVNLRAGERITQLK